MIGFIDDHRAAHGVEPICGVLPITPSTYHAHAAQRVDPGKASARARRDAVLRAQIRQVFDANFAVYGVRKVWRQLGREGTSVARCTVARLMRQMGLRGVVRGKQARTCPADRVNRQFRASRPKPAVANPPYTPSVMSYEGIWQLGKEHCLRGIVA
jgi:transposase InsO family protein